MSALPQVPPHDLSSEYLYEYRGASLIATAAFFIALQTIFVYARTYSRSINKAKIGADDVLVWLSLVACLGVNILSIVMVKYAGVGRHLFALEYLGEGHKVFLWGKLLFVAQFAYALAVPLPKLAILALYKRIFVMRHMQIILWALTTIVALNTMAGIIVSLVECRPLTFLWDKTEKGLCLDINSFFRWTSFPSIVTGVCMMVLPLPTIWKLQSSRYQKIGLTMIFLAGGVGLFASLFRFATFFQTDALQDGTFASAHLMLWSFLEPGMYLIASCLLAFRPLLKLCMKKIGVSVCLMDSGKGDCGCKTCRAKRNNSDMESTRMAVESLTRGTPVEREGRRGGEKGSWVETKVIIKPLLAVKVAA